MPGHHNALNATAAIAVAYRAQDAGRGDPQGARRASAASSGASPARANGTARTIFDDYGHHPVEIAAVLRAARASTRQQVIAVVQPHRYTRLQSLFDDFATCFNDADAVIVADVYAAGEAPIEGVDRDHLVAAIKAHGHRNVQCAARGAGRPCRPRARSSPSRATTSSASAPATSRNGPTRCRSSWRRGVTTGLQAGRDPSPPGKGRSGRSRKMAAGSHELRSGCRSLSASLIPGGDAEPGIGERVK